MWSYKMDGERGANVAQTKKKQSTTKQSASCSRATKQSTKNSHKRQTSSKKKQAATPLQLEIQNWLILFAMILITLGIYLKGIMEAVEGKV